jgi:hypothetical protein
VEHYARVLADRAKRHRLFEFSGDFAHDLDRFGLKACS